MPCNTANIVASVALTGQASDIAETTLFTPSTAGLFRASIYVEAGSAQNGRSTAIQLPYTDELDSSVVLGGVSGSYNSPGHLVSAFHAAAAQPISYLTSSDAGTLDFNLYIVLEQLTTT